jgi:hypothetical protein
MERLEDLFHTSYEKDEERARLLEEEEQYRQDMLEEYWEMSLENADEAAN